MLTIRREQMHVFGEVALAHFVEQAYGVVGTHWRQQTDAAGEEPTRKRLRLLALEAHRLGLRSPQQALRFINVVFALGDDFASRHAWARRVVDHQRLSPQAKLNLLVEKTAAWLDDEDVE